MQWTRGLQLGLALDRDHVLGRLKRRWLHLLPGVRNQYATSDWEEGNVHETPRLEMMIFIITNESKIT